MKKTILQKVCEKWDLPQDAVTNDPFVTMYGKGKIAVDRHGSILEYTTERICLSSRTGILTVCGKGLTITLLTKDRLEICGEICSAAWGQSV